MDVQSLIEEHDQSQFLDLLAQFPDQVQNAWEIGQRFEFDPGKINSVLVCGMGGSGISGDLLSQFLFHQSEVPIQSHRFYDLPSWVDERTLVITVSYSGNTEETVSCFREANERSAQCVGLTSNGTIEYLAREQEHDVLVVPPGLPPRCAAGYLFIPLLFVLEQAGVAEVPGEEDYSEACEELLSITKEFSPDSEENRALTIARRIQDSVPIVYGSEEITSVLAHRLKNQLNENAKMFAVSNVIPELHHNEIMGWEFLEESEDNWTTLFLRDAGEHSRIQRRFEITRQLLEPHVERIDEVQGRGESLLARFLSLMLYTDYISYYLAILRGKDPVAIGPIEQLKEKLKE
ncbi:MAG: bifunctional phosphoglucose/phosphomannose isomerase [bacterium]